MPQVEDTVIQSLIGKSNLHLIVPLAGCTKIPKVQQLLHISLKGRSSAQVINPDEVVVYDVAGQ